MTCPALARPSRLPCRGAGRTVLQAACPFGLVAQVLQRSLVQHLCYPVRPTLLSPPGGSKIPMHSTGRGQASTRCKQRPGHGNSPDSCACCEGRSVGAQT
eukprot:7834409-Alexandrium_andersonii.AAC.1